MEEKESHDAAVEARHDIAGRLHAPLTHMDAMSRYLSGVAYLTARDPDRKHAGPRRGEAGQPPAEQEPEADAA